MTGGGTFPSGSSTTLTATANLGYTFSQWQDGNTDNPRTVVVNDNLEFVAEFVAIPLYTITVNSSNNDWGYVLGGGTFIEGTETQISAFANTGYMFAGWNDGNNQNPRTITVNSNMSIAAFFATGIDEDAMANVKVYPNPTKESIRLIGIEANSQVEIYNSLGELVRVVSASENQEINVRDLASGLYMVRCGNATLRFVKEQ